MLIAVDTNVLFDLASDVEAVVDAVGTIRRLIKDARIIVPPTALHEVALTATRGDTERKRRIAGLVLSRLAAEWRFQPVNLVPVGHGIVERIAVISTPREIVRKFHR